MSDRSMRYSSVRAYVFLCALAGIVSFGCQQTKLAPIPELHPVKGKVTLDGQPLAGAMITFMPDMSSKAAASTAISGPDGSYELIYSGAPGQTLLGAEKGDYKVTISVIVDANGTPLKLDPEKGPMAFGGKESIPEKYSIAFRTILTATVPASGDVNFDLQSK